MVLKTQIHTPDEDREVVERLVGENLKNKIGSYLNKLDGEDVEGILDLKIEKNKKGLFIGILQINIDGKSFRYEREDYKNLDDLVNHLFDHFKEELAKK
ncbi:MAG: hypothetical protein PHE25_01880 [Candidatus Gracilibacteria bacterium]|nr:hypothetical protein [Candidatus Gracilibacteria bacterium]